MRTVYVVVHPEATHHVDGVVGGWHDSELTVAGHEDADRVAHAIRALVPAGARVALHSSDLRRCRTVADRIGELLDVPVATDPDLREKSYGVAEGRPQSWLEERFLPPPAEGERLEHHEGIEGAETKRDLAQRLYAALDRALAGPAEHLVLVTHGFALTFLVAAWARLPIDSLGYLNLRSTPGGITVLREDDHFHNRQVVTLDGVAHLT